MKEREKENFPKDELFVTCGEEIESLLEKELEGFGCQKLKQSFRGVYVQTSSEKIYEEIYKINYGSRLASRVLLPLKKFRCYNARSLYKEISEIDWSRFIPKGKTLAIDANVTHKQLRHSLFAAQVVKDAICDQLRQEKGYRPNINVARPDIQLNLFINEPFAVISFDTSGIPLHKRGYRQESVEAPVKETVAAALLSLANFEGQEVFCDPCCGSGTLLIEAALMATKTPPGYLRSSWGFMLLPGFSQEAWLKIKAGMDKKRKELVAGQFFGCDNNKNAVRVCKTNIRAAGFHPAIEIMQNDFRDYIPPQKPSLVFTNPPHGKRLEQGENLKPLYRALGDFMKLRSAKPARGFIFTSQSELAKEIGLAPKKRHVINNSGIDSRLLEFDLF